MFKHEGESRAFKVFRKINKYSTYFDLTALFLLGFYGVFNRDDFNDIDSEWIQSIITFLYDEKFWIAVIALGIVSLKKVFYKLYLIKRQPYRFRKDVMYAMLKDLFDDNRKIRITLFKDAGNTKNFFYNIGAYIKFIYNKIGVWSGGKFGNTPFQAPKWGRYIQVYQRAGWEMKKSDTKFFYSPNTIHHCEGIAARVIQNYEKIEKTNLPNIQDIDLDKINLNDHQDEDVVKVKEYMRRSHISDFNTLKNLNSKAQHFKADAVWGDNGPVGVLIIDCLEDSNPFESIETSRIDNYINLLGSTFGGNLYDG